MSDIDRPEHFDLDECDFQPVPVEHAPDDPRAETQLPTVRQVDYLVDLALDRGHPPVPLGPAYTTAAWAADIRAWAQAPSTLRSTVSHEIDRLLAQPRRPASTAIPAPLRARDPEASPFVAANNPGADGLYVRPGDAQVLKIQRNVAQGDGTRYFVKLLDPRSGRFDYITPPHRQRHHLVELLAHPEWRATRSQAATFGHLYARCMSCGRSLTDETSIAEGFGPICARRQGWTIDS